MLPPAVVKEVSGAGQERGRWQGAPAVGTALQPALSLECAPSQLSLPPLVGCPCPPCAGPGQAQGLQGAALHHADHGDDPQRRRGMVSAPLARATAPRCRRCASSCTRVPRAAWGARLWTVNAARCTPPACTLTCNNACNKHATKCVSMRNQPPSHRRPNRRYTSRGFGMSYITHFTGMPTGNVVAHIMEGRTARISVVSWPRSRSRCSSRPPRRAVPRPPLAAAIFLHSVLPLLLLSVPLVPPLAPLPPLLPPPSLPCSACTLSCMLTRRATPPRPPARSPPPSSSSTARSRWAPCRAVPRCSNTPSLTAASRGLPAERQHVALTAARDPAAPPTQVGTLYSTRDGHKTLQNVFALDLFDNVQVRRFAACPVAKFVVQLVQTRVPRPRFGSVQIVLLVSAGDAWRDGGWPALAAGAAPPGARRSCACRAAGASFLNRLSLTRRATAPPAGTPADPAASKREGPVARGGGGHGAGEAHADGGRRGGVGRRARCGATRQNHRSPCCAHLGWQQGTSSQPGQLRRWPAHTLIRSRRPRALQLAPARRRAAPASRVPAPHLPPCALQATLAAPASSPSSLVARSLMRTATCERIPEHCRGRGPVGWLGLAAGRHCRAGICA